MKINKFKAIIASCLLASQNCFCQGFVNLNFEEANLAAFGSGPATVPVVNGIPNWTAYLDGISQANILFNNTTLGAAAVGIHGTNNLFGPMPLSGNYSIPLQGLYENSPFPGYPDTSGIGQTGQISTNIQSLKFWGAGIVNMKVTFNSQPINIILIGSGTDYTIYSGDISAFAGQTGQLLFTVSNFGVGLLDNIEFSSSPIPEPSTFVLAMVGGVLLGFRRRKTPRLP